MDYKITLAIICLSKWWLLDGVSSEFVPVTSGGPQGSILGPIIIISTFYKRHMPDCAEHSILSLFADDAKCFRKINNGGNCERLQHDLNSLYEWSQIWKLNFNVNKCKVVLFTRNIKPIVFDCHLNE